MTNPRENYLTANPIRRFLLNRFYRNLKKIIEPLEIKNVLEVGCGAGFSTKRLKQLLKEARLEAMDIREDLVKEARIRNPGVLVKCGDIYKLKMYRKPFDLIIVLEVLEHLTSPESALRQLQKASRYCLLSVPREPYWRILNLFRGKYIRGLGNTPDHKQNWTGEQFTELIKKYFQIKKVKTSLPWLIVLAEKNIQ